VTGEQFFGCSNFPACRTTAPRRNIYVAPKAKSVPSGSQPSRLQSSSTPSRASPASSAAAAARHHEEDDLEEEEEADREMEHEDEDEWSQIVGTLRSNG
jgi:ssDNA-binding Zn-finger/Zn-ribbon topoisomerase 1